MAAALQECTDRRRAPRRRPATRARRRGLGVVRCRAGVSKLREARERPGGRSAFPGRRALAGVVPMETKTGRSGDTDGQGPGARQAAQTAPERRPPARRACLPSDGFGAGNQNQAAACILHGSRWVGALGVGGTDSWEWGSGAGEHGVRGTGLRGRAWNRSDASETQSRRLQLGGGPAVHGSRRLHPDDEKCHPSRTRTGRPQEVLVASAWTVAPLLRNEATKGVTLAGCPDPTSLLVEVLVCCGLNVSPRFTC